MEKQTTVLITGASEGIGKAIALCLLEHDYRIILVSRSEEKLSQVLVDAENFAENALIHPADMTDSQQVSMLVEAIADREGKIDVLVNNLGQGLFRELVDTSDEDWDYLVKTNLSSAFYACRAVLPYMRDQKKGVIVNIASRAGRRGEGDFAAYSALKHGMVGLTRALADSEAKYGIRVNAVCPGAVATERMLAAHPEANHSGWNTPEGVAESVLFLLSPAAETMNGQMLDLFKD